MPPVRAIKNQYRGINAHLHSLWQSAGGWNNFHNPHIAELARAFIAQLVPRGYRVEIEDSVQIRRSESTRQHLRADISIYDVSPARPATTAQPALTGTVVPLPLVLADTPLAEKPYRALAIFAPDSSDLPVTWLEVLSPSNKRAGNDLEVYLHKRADLVERGIVFVELDYLHETPPTLPRIPNYAARDFPVEKAHPYRIIVLEPRPEVESGRASINEFDVDMPLPAVTIPLSGEDALLFDFDAPYQKQFAEMFYGVQSGIDYAELPLNFDRYSPADQQRIAARMVAVLQAAHEGHDLESAPLPVNTPALEEALALIERWQKET